jgi:hypothetical protein
MADDAIAVSVQTMERGLHSARSDVLAIEEPLQLLLSFLSTRWYTRSRFSYQLLTSIWQSQQPR